MGGDGEAGDALRALQASRRPVCLFGHTHVQVGYRLAGYSLTLATMDPVRPLDVPVADGRFLINPGSVGQPRDGDWRACYVLFDGKRVRYRRVEYDIDTTVKKIYEIPDLENFLGDRLRDGR